MCSFRGFGVFICCCLFWGAAVAEINTPDYVVIYGHPYEIELSENTFLARQLDPDNGVLAGRHYQGKLIGHDGSWVRVSQIDGGWTGIVSLSGQVYLVDMDSNTTTEQEKNAAQDAGNSLLAVPVSEFQPVACGCGAEHSAHSKAFIDPNVHSALQAPKEVQFSSLCEITVGDICLLAEVEFVFDQDFQQAFSGNAREEAESLINMAEGFYRNDLGVIFDTITLELLDSDVFDTTVVGGDLLEDMRIKKNGGQLPFIKNNRALLHLVTGRELTDEEDDSALAGVAYLDSLCNQFGYGVGTSQLLRRFNGRPDLRLTALVVAHELGHNFGANHDVDDNDCGAGFVMEPTVNSSASGFSDCSQDEMQDSISDIPSPEICFNFPVDLQLVAASENDDEVPLGESLTLNFDLQNRSAYLSVLEARVVGTVLAGEGQILSATLDGVDCVVAGDGLSYECTVGNPDVGSRVSVELQSDAASSGINLTQTVSVVEGADVKDIVPGNDVLHTNISIDPPTPDSPSNLVLNQVGFEVEISWQDNSDDEDGFRIERRVNGEAFSELVTLGVDVTNHVDDTVSVGVDYEYRVIAFNSFGDSVSFAEGNITVDDLPEGASGLSLAQEGETSVHARWQDNSDTEDGFRLERRESGGEFSPVVMLDANVINHVDYDIAPGNTYEYRVFAFNGAGDANPSQTVSIDVIGRIVAPTEVSANVRNDGSVEISWKDNSDGELGYRVRRFSHSGNLDVDLEPNVESYVDSSVISGDFYTYDVVGFNALGDGHASDPVRVAVGGIPDAPSLLSAEQGEAIEVVLSWSDNSDNEFGFQLQRREVGGSFDWERGVATDSTSYTDATVSVGISYEYRLSAGNNIGQSEFTDIVSITVVDVEGLPTVPNAPSGLSVLQQNGNELHVSWQDNSDNETGFRLERSVDGHSFTTIANLSADITDHTDSNIFVGSNYRYRVIAENDVGDSVASNLVSITPIEVVPAAPSGASVSRADGTNVTVTWVDNSNNEDGFRIERRVGDGSFSELTTLNVDAETHKDTFTSNNTKYSYRVISFNGAGESAASNITTITLGTPPSPPSPSGGGGSFGWLWLLLLPLVWIRQRKPEWLV